MRSRTITVLFVFYAIVAPVKLHSNYPLCLTPDDLDSASNKRRIKFSELYSVFKSSSLTSMILI